MDRTIPRLSQRPGAGHLREALSVGGDQVIAVGPLAPTPGAWSLRPALQPLTLADLLDRLNHPLDCVRPQEGLRPDPSTYDGG